MTDDLEFFFKGMEVGYFEEKDHPKTDGEYAYEPYRGPGHYEMQVALSAEGKTTCYYDVGQQRIVFVVRKSESPHFLRLSEFQVIRRYEHFADLPNHVKAWLLRKVGPRDPEHWSSQPIPALGNQSVLEVMNGPDGERRIIDYLQRLPDSFGAG